MPHGSNSSSKPPLLPPFLLLRRRGACRLPSTPPSSMLSSQKQWLDSSKPCWQSGTPVSGDCLARRRSRPSRGWYAPLARVFSAVQMLDVCAHARVCGVYHPSAIAHPSEVISVLCRDQHPTAGSSRGYRYLWRCVCKVFCIPGWALRVPTGGRDVPYSVRPPVNIPSGAADQGAGSSQIRTEGATSGEGGAREQRGLFLFLCYALPCSAG